jgi:hypothetical protein
MTDLRIQGIACALAELVRLHGSEVEAKDVLNGFGLTYEDLVVAGVDARDLGALADVLDIPTVGTAEAGVWRDQDWRAEYEPMFSKFVIVRYRQMKGRPQRMVHRELGLPVKFQTALDAQVLATHLNDQQSKTA